MLCPILEARKQFANNTSRSRCVVAVDSRQTDPQPITALFDLNGWAVTWLDVGLPMDTTIIARLTALLGITDLTYVIVGSPSPALLDLGYVFGAAKHLHRPVFVDFRGDLIRDDYPSVFKLADGIGFGADDLSLFIDTFETFTELVDPLTRARAVCNKIKRLRIS